MNLLRWTSEPRFVSWETYEQRMQFLEDFHFQQETRRQNVVNISKRKA